MLLKQVLGAIEKVKEVQPLNLSLLFSTSSIHKAVSVFHSKQLGNQNENQSVAEARNSKAGPVGKRQCSRETSQVGADPMRDNQEQADSSQWVSLRGSLLRTVVITLLTQKVSSIGHHPLRKSSSMVSTQQEATSVFTRMDVATQTELTKKYAAIQVSDCRMCQRLTSNWW